MKPVTAEAQLASSLLAAEQSKSARLRADAAHVLLAGVKIIDLVSCSIIWSDMVAALCYTD